MQCSIFYLSILLAHALAAPASVPTSAPDSGCSDNPGKSQSFSLVAKVVRSSIGIDVNNWVVTGAHSGAGETLQVLTNADPLDQTRAGVYYQNGTGGVEDTVLAAGTGTLVSGMRIVPSIAPMHSNYVVNIAIGAGSPGIWVRHGGPNSTMPYSYLVGKSATDGQFYTCNMTLFDPKEPLQALYWRYANGTTPASCAEIILVPQCFGDLGNTTTETQHVQSANCYEKALQFTLAK